MEPLVIAKFGGSALGVNGAKIPIIIDRIRELKKKSKIICVFSAPLTNYEGKNMSMTDVAIRISKNYASSNPVDIDVLKTVYLGISNKYLSNADRLNFESELEKLNKTVLISLKQVAENRRFVDVSRSRILAYSGEIVISLLMDYILKSNGIKSSSVNVNEWPIVTDDNFEAASFLLDESKNQIDPLIRLVKENDVLCIGGFIGKTVDGLETTYERGGSDRSAADLGILLSSQFNIILDFEKDNSVLSADPKIVSKNLHNVKTLSYNEAKLAGMFGMKILDPIAIKDIDDNDLNLTILVTNISNPSNYTQILKRLSDDELESEAKIKIVTGKKNCAIVRMESIAASHIAALFEKQRQYHDFIKLSPYKKDNLEMTRFLFLDGDYVKRHEKVFRSFYPRVEMVYGRGVVTLIGDSMWKIPKIVSDTSSIVSQQDINILNIDAQEETSRILILVEDQNVEEVIRSIHSKGSIIS
ncbi:MAG: aspartate kinase [Candidatus Nitrosocosmicus sp.]|nr:aspartate kinase [Candidatus Nitrosocosmicus sp.]MDN5867215.1 aspartate kinase [Candidatus Nitrosocosmicus sp.]